MKKVAFISGLAAVLFLIFTLVGFIGADADAPVFNGALAAYKSGDYVKAVEYFEKCGAGAGADKYLYMGNAYYYTALNGADPYGVFQNLDKALQAYKDGILAYPREVPLKYNYEYVKKVAESLLEESEKENSGGGENGGDENNGDDENGGGENGGGGNGDSGGDGNGNDGGSGEDGGDVNNGGGEGSSGGEDNGEAGEDGNTEDESADNNSGDENGGDGPEESDGGGGGDASGGDDSGAAGDNQAAYGENAGVADDREINQDEEAINRILRMLEAREEESLKNNQGIVGGKNDKNGW